MPHASQHTHPVPQHTQAQAAPGSLPTAPAKAAGEVAAAAAATAGAPGAEGLHAASEAGEPEAKRAKRGPQCNEVDAAAVSAPEAVMDEASKEGGSEGEGMQGLNRW